VQDVFELIAERLAEADVEEATSRLLAATFVNSEHEKALAFHEGPAAARTGRGRA
jgi:hypothetical protein